MVTSSLPAHRSLPATRSGIEVEVSMRPRESVFEVADDANSDRDSEQRLHSYEHRDSRRDEVA